MRGQGATGYMSKEAQGKLMLRYGRTSMGFVIAEAVSQVKHFSTAYGAKCTSR